MQKINELVSVQSQFDHQKKQFLPTVITWAKRDYLITKIALHHSFYQGRVLFHVFSVLSHNIYFRLIFNTQNLFWTLDGVDNEN